MEFLGHEIWIEGPDHGHLGSASNVQCKYGHNLAVDGRFNISLVTAYLFDPKGNKSDMVLFSEPSVTKDAYMVSFTPIEEGFYTILLDYPAGIWCKGVDGRNYYAPSNRCPEVTQSIRHHQFSKAVIPVGHGLAAETPPAVGAPLEIIPQNFTRPAEGDEVTVQVLYQGTPLPNADLRIAGGVEVQASEAKTDQNGLASIKFGLFGPWMILASYEDRDKGVSGEYEAEKFTSVLSVQVKP